MEPKKPILVSPISTKIGGHTAGNQIMTQKTSTLSKKPHLLVNQILEKLARREGDMKERRADVEERRRNARYKVDEEVELWIQGSEQQVTRLGPAWCADISCRSIGIIANYKGISGQQLYVNFQRLTDQSGEIIPIQIVNVDPLARNANRISAIFLFEGDEGIFGPETA